jgi:tyrosyl-tRNA synthetase
MGGSDQWGNIVNGVDLGRRMGTHQLYALTCPLLTTASGAKMGKTADGAVWLNADMLPVYKYWQFWRGTEDGDVTRFLKLFTVLPLAEIARLGALQGAEINEAKKVLATEATALLHGRAEADKAAAAARATFEEGTVSVDLPTVEMPAYLSDDFFNKNGVPLIAAAQIVKFARSNGEAARLIDGRGLRVNDAIVELKTRMLTPSDLTPERVIKLSLGRKNHVLLKPL